MYPRPRAIVIVVFSLSDGCLAALNSVIDGGNRIADLLEFGIDVRVCHEFQLLCLLPRNTESFNPTHRPLPPAPLSLDTGDEFSDHRICSLAQRLQRLARRSAADRRWDVFPVALGDREETAVLNLTTATGFNSFLTPNSLARGLFEAGTEIQGEVRVSVDRLDRILPTLLPAVNQRRVFLKVDTQGYDLKVLRGAGAQLESLVGVQG